MSQTEKFFLQKEKCMSSSVAAVNKKLEDDLINFEYKLHHVQKCNRGSLVDDAKIKRMKDGLDQMFEDTFTKVCTMNSFQSKIEVIEPKYDYTKEMSKLSSAYFVINHLMGRSTPIFLRTN